MKLSKIQTNEEKERKERKQRVWMAIVVTALLGLSTAAYAFMEIQGNESRKYNGITFYKTTNGWQPKKINIFTSFFPADVENITIQGDLKLEDFSGIVYVNALGEVDMNAANELLKTLPIEKAVLSCSPENENEAFCSDLPIKSCADARSGNEVINFENSNESSIEYDNYCLIIKSSPENTLKTIDRAIFELYKLI